VAARRFLLSNNISNNKNRPHNRIIQHCVPLSPPAKATAYGRTEGLMAGALAAQFGRIGKLRVK